MEKIERYRQYIQNLLMKYSSYESSEEDIEEQLIFDTERDHYQILDIGWDGCDRIYNCVMHLDIKDGRIWIQRNTTSTRNNFTSDR
jgi:XisI protein